MLVGFALFAGIASAFLDNVTTILLLVPVSITICDDLGLDSRPFLVSEVIASNIGGTATLIGHPPDILIGSATGLDFLDFAVNLGPVVALLLALMVGGFWIVFRRRDRLGTPSADGQRALREADARIHIGDESATSGCCAARWPSSA
jgi:Na+/H+ antiporter NhaD/arsenite permease-like protein